MAAIHQRQATLRTARYEVVRTDTLVTGDTRQLSGHVQLRAQPGLFGYHFLTTQVGQPTVVLYDETIARMIAQLLSP